jgi:predicted RNA-binding protein YlqC (UPF0109 family)
MKEILEFIIKNITTHPDDVVITEETIDGVTNYSVTVNQEDVGRVIGKEGKIIKSIRAIMRVIAIQRNVRVRVSVLSENEMGAPMEATAEETTEEAPEVPVAVPETDESLTVEL